MELAAVKSELEELKRRYINDLGQLQAANRTPTQRKLFAPRCFSLVPNKLGNICQLAAILLHGFFLSTHHLGTIICFPPWLLQHSCSA